MQVNQEVHNLTSGEYTDNSDPFPIFPQSLRAKSDMNNSKINNTASFTVRFIPSHISLAFKQRGSWYTKPSNLKLRTHYRTTVKFIASHEVIQFWNNRIKTMRSERLWTFRDNILRHLKQHNQRSNKSTYVRSGTFLGHLQTQIFPGCQEPHKNIVLA